MSSYHGTLLDEHARELSGMGEDWHVYRFENVMLGKTHVGYRLNGAVAPRIPPCPGERYPRFNWKKKDKATDREVTFTTAEHEAWVAKWEVRTGLCSDCMGDGKTLASAGMKDGQVVRSYRNCRQCKGSGKAKVATGGSPE